MNNKRKIFICCTEQSGENIVFNICKKLRKYNYQIDGVCGKSSEKYFTNNYYEKTVNLLFIGILRILLGLYRTFIN